MSLAQILYPPPGADGFKTWVFWHGSEHAEIVAAVQKIAGVALPLYVLDPMNTEDMEGWALRHQAAHNDMNQFLQLPGSDLQSIDLNNTDQMREWFYMDFQDHAAARIRLGI